MRLPILMLSLSALLPACFLSSWPEQDECRAIPTCQVGYSEVGVCSASDCTLETTCGQSIYCQRDCDDFACSDFQSEVPFCDVASPDCSLRTSSCGEVYCQDALCNGLPMCDEGENEVESCAGRADCRSVSVCGTTIYCETLCVEPAVCGPGFTQQDSCPVGEVCEERTHCGVTVYCVEEPSCLSLAPCTGAPSTVVGGGSGICPLVTPGPGPQDNCYSETLCGVVGHCVLACNLGHTEVADPSECWSDGICYRGISLEGEVWCTGEGIACEAEPFCEEEEREIGLDVVCTGRRQCRFVEACGTTIQCERQANVDG